MSYTYTDKTDKSDRVSRAMEPTEPIRPLEDARQNPNSREQAYYGLYATDVPQLFDGTRPPVRDVDLTGGPTPASIQLDGPIPDAPPPAYLATAKRSVVSPDAPTMRERKRLRLALQGIELPPPPPMEELPRYSSGKNFTERAAIRKLRNAAGVLDDAGAAARREFMMHPPAGLVPTVLTDL